MKQADRELQRRKLSDGSIMSRVPNFASIDSAAVTPTALPAGASWLTPEGIAVLRQIAHDETLGDAARSVLSAWHVDQSRLTG